MKEDTVNKREALPGETSESVRRHVSSLTTGPVPRTYRLVDCLI